ncbi:hypothetical protein I3F60_11620 [Streptomyces sp. MUM 136J]|nr:hypothetical protein [Streptomyces sp. MUM 136J]MCH0569890.1 hypothetical protein [Streptomyces sp. MUM 136J]
MSRPSVGGQGAVRRKGATGRTGHGGGIRETAEGRTGYERPVAQWM